VNKIWLCNHHCLITGNKGLTLTRALKLIRSERVKFKLGADPFVITQIGADPFMITQLGQIHS
jgi:hypothetical protein